MGYEELLSVGSLAQILEGQRPANPVLQIIGFKPMSPDQMTVGPATDELRYRLMIGDGARSHQYCVITNQEIVEDIKNGRLEKWSIIRVTSYSTADYGDGAPETRKRLIYILNLELVKKGSDVRCKISCELPDDPMSARPQMPSYGLNQSTMGQPVQPLQSTIGQPQHNYNHGYDTITQPQPYHIPGSRTESIKSPRSMRTNRSYIEIATLSPYIGKFIIKGRCTDKLMNMRTYTNAKGPGKLFHFALTDATGEIKVTAFNAEAERYFDFVELQKVYTLANGSIKNTDKRYNSADYEILLNSDSHLELVRDESETDNIPKMKLNFVSLGSLANLNENSTVDIIGAILNVSEVTTIMSKTKNKELKKRNITIVDMSRHSVSVTLWGDAAENFNGNEKDIFVNKGARLSFYGGRSLSAGDCIFLNPDTPEMRKIRAWFDKLIDRNFTSLSNSQEGGHNDQWKSLAEMTDLAKARELNATTGQSTQYSKCKATILAVGKNPVYKCCPVEGCGKKLIDTQNGEMKCEKCQQTYSNYRYRYKTDVEIGDATTSSWVTLWDEKAEALFNTKPEALEKTMRAENKEAYERILSKPNFKSFIFSLKSRIDIYQNEERVKLQVMNMVNEKPVDYGKRLIEDIKAMSAAAAY